MFSRLTPFFPWQVVCVAILVALYLTLAGDYLLKGDIIETFHMGRDLTLFYPKHPPVTFWLAGGVLRLVPMDMLLPVATLILYAGYAFVVYMAWKFCNIYFNDYRLSVLVSFSIGISIFTKFIYLTPDFMALVLSPAMAWFLYKAVLEDRLYQWMAVAVLSLLFFFSKYQALVTLITLALVILFTPEGRKSFTSKNFWFAICFFSVFVVPYCLYLLTNKVAAVSYAEAGAGMHNTFHFRGVLLGPLSVAFVPLVLCLFFFSRQKISAGLKDFTNQLTQWSFDTAFLVINSLGYWFVWFVFCFAFEHELQVRFLIMNAIFFNILLFIMIKPLAESLSDRKIRNTVAFLTPVSVIAFAINVYNDNNWQEYALFEKAYSEIHQDIGANVDFIVVDRRALDTFYDVFEEKPHFRVLAWSDKDAVYSEVAGKTALFLWRERDGIEPAWIIDLKKQYPHLSAIKTIDLQSTDKHLLGIPLKDTHFNIHYAYLKGEQ